jgi:hypothetical protein
MALPDHDGDLITRTRFMRITPATTEVLRAFWKVVEPNLAAILDGFYQHVASEPHLRQLVGDNTALSNAPRPAIGSACSRATSMPPTSTACTPSASCIIRLASNPAGISAATLTSKTGWLRSPSALTAGHPASCARSLPR